MEDGRVTWNCSEAWAPLQPPWCWDPVYFSPVYICPLIECIPGLYLYLGHCESNCPPKTYPGINAKERAACMPCHYTCLTCAGESEGHCTSCHDEAVPTPSGINDEKDVKTFNQLESFLEDLKPEVKVEDLPAVVEDDSHLSWGKRSLVNISVLSKKAVTKKILEPYNSPRILFYCVPLRVVNEINATQWYKRMFLLFTVNLLVMGGFLLYFLWFFCTRKRNEYNLNNMKLKYTKMSRNGSSLNFSRDENILYMSSSSEED